MHDLMRDVARRHQAEMRARAAEDHEAARLERTRAAATGGPVRRSLAWLAGRIRRPVDGRRRAMVASQQTEPIADARAR